VKKGNDWVDEVCFVTCVAWGRTAEVASEYATKGSPILIEGRLKMDSFEKDGQKRTTLKVTVDKLQLLSSRSAGERQPQAEPAGVTTNDDPFGGEIDF
jgi:single-strand DNA-binding protein